jgi:UDP-4-amino-4,6-dideoxy-N-acetyl-beta-L-altrosamine N-acetyltransferase
MVLDWRNNEDIRRWMYHFDTISIDEHLSFIESLKPDQTKQYYLVLQDNNPIGVIYFTNIDKETKKAEFGIYKNPHLSGYGNILMHKVCEHAFITLNLHALVAEVFADNQKAIHLYNHFNFKQTDEKYFTNKKVIYMELFYENW